MLNVVTVKDIQPKNVRTDSNPNNQNKVRRAWVSMLPETTIAAIKSKLKDPEVRWAYYASTDHAVTEVWIELMRGHYEASIQAGAKVVLDKVGGERLEDDFCVDADEHLIQAAERIAYDIVESFR